MSKISAITLLLKEKVRPLLHPRADARNRQHAVERKKLYGQFLFPGALVFDVGANLGNRVETFLLLDATVVAFEPQATCSAYLKLKYGRRIAVSPIALGAELSKGNITLNRDASTIATMSQEWMSTVATGRFSAYRWGSTQPVAIDTLENQIVKYGRPDFVKIDVEGFEEQVLKGLKTPVAALSFEYSTPEMTRAALKCIELIHNLSPAYEFNFAAGEQTWLENENWLDYAAMRNVLTGNIEKLKGAGDIYARLRKT